MTNNQIVIKILETLEKEHINLYHDVSKDEVLKYIESVRNWDTMTDVQFDLEMLKLFAMFKDAHTTYVIPNIPLENVLTYIQEKFYVLDNKNWKEITHFGRLNVSEMRKKVEPLICYETQEYLSRKIKILINNFYLYKMLNINNDNSHFLTLSDGTKLELYEMSLKNQRQWKAKPPYTFKILENNILYFQYRRCVDDKNNPFSKFINDINREIENNNLRKYILDVRNNTGGNSELLNPFQELVKVKNLNGVLLINNGVFSSGRFAVARFKKEFNTPLIGEPTGGAVKSYGYAKPLEIAGKHFSASIRLWNFSDVFGYEGAIQPDIIVEETIDNMQNQEDIILKTAIDFINHQKYN